MTDAVAGLDGTIWVRREETFGETARWQVFNGDGKRIAELEMPATARVLLASGDRVWLAVRDSLEIPHLVRYRLSDEGTSESPGGDD